MLTLKLATRALAQRARSYATTMPSGGGGTGMNAGKSFYEKNAPLVWLGGAAAVGGLIYYAREDESSKKKTVAQAGGVEIKK